MTSRPGLPAVIEEGSLSMTDGDPEGLRTGNAFIRVGLERFCELREQEGEEAVSQTVAQLLDMDGKSLVLFAAQAGVELHEPGCRVPIEHDEEEES